jgi:hypothetical protein
MPMSDDYQRIELITGTARRRRWTTEQKLRIIEATYAPGAVSLQIMCACRPASDKDVVEDAPDPVRELPDILAAPSVAALSASAWRLRMA